ncbi:hypothetical protein [Streptomyces sp. NPDC088923]|uniref:hypothetical protein n=1 Tax=Streptomyces sp. NPDC088923 TaxID=3365913 RepID=UPI0037F8100D
MNRLIPLMHQALLGALAASVVISVAWLILGEPPTWWVTFLGADFLAVLVSTAVKRRRRREARSLDAAYERPAFGEEQ